MIVAIIDGQEYQDGFVFASMDAKDFPKEVVVDGELMKVTPELMETLMVEQYTKETGNTPLNPKEAFVYFEDRYLVQARQMLDRDDVARAEEQRRLAAEYEANKAAEEGQRALEARKIEEDKQKMLSANSAPVQEHWAPVLPTGMEGEFLINTLRRWGNKSEHLRTIATVWLATPSDPNALAPRVITLNNFMQEFPVDRLALEAAVMDMHRTMPNMKVTAPVLFGILLERVITSTDLLSLRAAVQSLANLIQSSPQQ